MNRFARYLCSGLFSLMPLTAGCQSRSADFPDPANTQVSGEHPPSPQEMLDLFELPDGFNVTLFAGEPDVQQPIAFDFDDRGRIWVAENYTYSELGSADPNYRDRIIILEDRDHNGEHDVRKVFWDQGNMLTGLTWGFGGLWILNDGTLSFIPDRDGDDIPDDEPIEMLNGWTKTARHNFVNGLLWGPDGWLYGRHGLTDSSLPGTPDTPEEERQPMNCGIWRFHPIQHVFEIVCRGTTNPWGLDYDSHGQLFMTNNVIGHLWHVIPGAHYERMLGQDFNPHLYELMGPCSDHYHWDHTGKWSESRDGKADDLGGGHSHCGGMIYYGDNFPKEYQGKMFMCNTHGRCVNIDRLEPQGSTYVAKHEPNFLKVNTPWFRGVELKYGPAGCVYLSDWSDNGECHDTDGVHRTSGRIYRIAWGDHTDPSPDAIVGDLPASSDEDLLGAALLGKNQWIRRRAMRLVLERTAASRFNPMQSLAQDPYRNALISDDNEILSINAAWLVLAMNRVVSEPFDAEAVRRSVLSRHEHVRALAIRLLVENSELLAALGQHLPALSRQDSSPLVRMTLASSLQKLAFDSSTSLGAQVAAGLTIETNNGIVPAHDSPLRRMIWYGIEPNYLHFTQFSKMEDAQLRHHYVRRWASDWDQNRGDLSIELTRRSRRSVSFSESQQDAWQRHTAEFMIAVLHGLQGQVQVSAPSNWKRTATNFRKHNDPRINRIVDELSAVFGDGAALADLRAIVADSNGDHSVRSKAVTALAAVRDARAIPILLEVLNDRAVCVDVIKALASFDDRRIPEQLLWHWANLRDGSRDHAIETMVSRKTYALAFVQAISDGYVNPTDITAGQARQLLAFREPRINRVIESQWGVINESSASRSAAVKKWKHALTTEVLSHADLAAGATLFKKTCAACHKLYGDGESIGPDLTGSNRGNLDYLLGNIVDPSSVVPKQFAVSVIVLKSGRIVTGVVVAETSNTATIQTGKEQIVVGLAEIEERTLTGRSLMPDGLLDSLSENQIRDLVAFLMKRR